MQRLWCAVAVVASTAVLGAQAPAGAGQGFPHAFGFAAQQQELHAPAVVVAHSE